MDLQVPCLGLVEDLTDVVHRALDGPDPPRGGGGSDASLSMGLGAGAVGPLDPKGPQRSGTLGLLGHQGLNWPPGARTRLPPQLLAPM
jgi:hypothetical protein